MVWVSAMNTAQHNPSQFGVSDEELRQLIATISSVDGLVMAGNGLRLAGYFVAYADGDMPDKYRLMVIISLFVFFQRHFTPKDTKLGKLVWKSHKKIGAFYLVGDILWIPCEFLMREVPTIVTNVDKKSVQFIRQLRETLLNEKGDAMLEEAVSYTPSAQEWRTKMRIENRHEGPRDAIASLSITELMLKGARIADIMCSLLRIVLNCHTGTVQISKAKAYKMFSIIENIKAISQTFADCRRMLLECCQMACQQWRCHSLALIDRAQLSAQASSDTHRAAAFHIAIQCLLGSESRTRLCICGVALEIAQYKETMGRLNSSQLDALISRLETLCKMDAIIERNHNNKWASYQFVSVLILSPLQHFTMAVSDCIRYVEKSKKRNQLGRFCEETVESIKKGFLYPLCAAIEVDLRVLSHQHLVVDERDSPSQQMLDFCKKMMFDPDIRLHGMILSSRGNCYFSTLIFAFFL
ncbi:unnamed protein product [Angiostrongylus costaricensis]|uniref:WASH-7_N domain-containing protein n=1 Tax=Angiostrongylus costaricensis TaxID=334426 RepID=A0A0R3PDG7_ANGCS|nr:unnamed protein product [Angiostrongylus costaricensis]